MASSKNLSKKISSLWIILILLAVVGLIGYFFIKNQRSQQVLAFEGNGAIYLLDTKTLERTQLPIDGLKEDLDELTFSPDSKKLYFNVNHADLFIYDFVTQKTKILSDMGPNPKPLSDFSPDSNYAIVDAGCCPGERGRILITSDGEILNKDSGTSFSWSPDSKKFALSKGETQILAVPTTPFYRNNSIYLKVIEGGKVFTKKLLQSNIRNNYDVLNWLDNETFIFRKEFFKEDFPHKESVDQVSQEHWTDIHNKPQITYWKYNIVDSSIVKTDKPKDKNYLDPEISPNNEWRFKVSQLYDGIDKGQIYLSKLDGSDKLKIGDGKNAVWKPELSPQFK